jgi:ferritin-like metal-binding protein YciE
MPVLRSPEDLLVTELKEIHSAERQLWRAIPKFSREARSDHVRQVLDKRRDQGATLIERLEDIFDEMDVRNVRQKNVAMEGLIEDADQQVEEIREEKLFDPVVLASLQKIEHYCIAAWGTARSMGDLMGRNSVVETMQEVIDEGKRFDREMTDLAENEVNPAMLDGGQDGQQGGRRRRRSR